MAARPPTHQDPLERAKLRFSTDQFGRTRERVGAAERRSDERFCQVARGDLTMNLGRLVRRLDVKLFGERLNPLIDELTEALAA